MGWFSCLEAGRWGAAARLVAILAAAVAFVTLIGRTSWAGEITGFKMAGDATRLRLVIDLDGEPHPNWFLLRGPHRLVIDLPDTKAVVHPKDLKPRGLVRNVRYGSVADGTSRFVLSIKGPFSVNRLEILPNEASPGHRLVADISAASQDQFESALSVQALTTGSTKSSPKGDRVAPPSLRQRPFTIVLDAGHGGVDGGAAGLNGTVEKTITLTFATELRDRLRRDGRYEVHMTREKDEFLRLDDRVRIARQHGADLLISIHADTINVKGIRGATVYTVSDTASDAEAAALADRENLSDQLAGVRIEEDDHQVADILIDLIRRETHGFSLRFAHSLVAELSRSVGLINNPHRSAGFKVLRAPDVPSVLVELGYLSNPKDEEQLRSLEWRTKAVDSIAKAIAVFADAKSLAGG